MPSLTQLEQQGRELARKQLDLVNDNSRPWSAKQAEFDNLAKDIEAVLAQHTALKTAEGGFAGMIDAAGTSGGRTTPLLGLRGSGGGARPDWAKEVADRVTKTVGEFGLKAITTGGIDLPQPLGINVQMTEAPHRVLDLLINRAPVRGNEFEYLRQTVRTSNAGPVADNALKPTSVYTFEDASDRVRVFAHLTEPVPERIFDDHAEVERIVQSQMLEDLYIALEEDALVGDGTGEHFTGITANPDIQTTVFATDELTTLRKALTQMVTSGERPNAWVFNYADLEAFDLMRENGATGAFLAGIEDKVFGGLPRVGSTVVPTGTAYLADWSQARLFVRQDARLDADRSGDLFDHNQVKLRLEGRYGFAVLKPHAFCAIDLAA